MFRKIILLCALLQQAVYAVLQGDYEKLEYALKRISCNVNYLQRVMSYYRHTRDLVNTLYYGLSGYLAFGREGYSVIPDKWLSSSTHPAACYGPK